YRCSVGRVIEEDPDGPFFVLVPGGPAVNLDAASYATVTKKFRRPREAPIVVVPSGTRMSYDGVMRYERPQGEGWLEQRCQNAARKAVTKLRCASASLRRPLRRS